MTLLKRITSPKAIAKVFRNNKRNQVAPDVKMEKKQDVPPTTLVLFTMKYLPVVMIRKKFLMKPSLNTLVVVKHW